MGAAPTDGTDRGVTGGRVIAERFVLEQLAGAGGMGLVYRARDLVTGHDAAVKLLRTDDRELVARFSREAQLLAELSHPGVVRYVGHGLTGTGETYLAMEWLVGQDLAAFLRRRTLRVEETVALAQKVCDALAAVHRRDIVHRDIKPPNLFLIGEDLDRPAAVKLLDFGVARLGARAATLSGVMVGTPGYMAPEQARGEASVDARADTFSFGCVIHACLAGRTPFAGPNQQAVLARILFEEPPRLRTLRPDVPAALDELVEAMLAKDAARRPDDETVARALARIAAGDGGGRATAPAAVLGLGEQHVASLLMARDGAGASPISVERLAAARVVATSHGARLEQLVDGTLVAVFAASTHGIDLANRAARCALALRPLLPGASVAMVTGRSPVDAAAVELGEVIDRASRVFGAAVPGGRIRLDEVSRSLLEVGFELADEDGPVLVGPREAGGARRVLGKVTPFVGRDRELGALEAMAAECVQDGSAKLALVTAPAGAGKSRLAHELVARLEGVPGLQIWRGQGDPMRSGAPFSILADALRRPMGIGAGDDAADRRARIHGRVARRFGEPDASRVSEFLGELCGVPFPDEGSVQLQAARQSSQLMGDQVRRAWERWLGAELAAGPVLILLEDLHWGDWPSIKLLDASLRALGEKPLMILGLARPEVHGLFPGLWTGRPLEEIHLRELPRAACERLVRQLLGSRGPDSEIVARIAARSRGNPFYIEELVRSVAQGGDDFPETVLAMVDARLARLDSRARHTLRAASIFGEVFWDAGVGALLGASAGSAVGDLLVELGELEWVVPAPDSRFSGCVEVSFAHALLREAAYASLTEEDRRAGHGLAGDWLERMGEANPLTLADHFRRAGMAERAGFQFARAAEQALEANDFAATIEHAQRAIASGAGGAALGRLQLLVAEAHSWRFEHAEAAPCARAAMALLPAGSDGWASAVHHAAWAASVLGGVDEVIALSGELRAALVARPSSTLLVAACVVAIKLIEAGRYEQAEPLLGAADDTAGVAGTTPISAAWLANAHAFRASVAGRPDQVLHALEAAAASWEEAGDERNACMARSNVAFAYLGLGGQADAIPVLRDAVLAADRLGLSYVVEGNRQNLGLALALDGQLAEGAAVERLAAEAFLARADFRNEGISRLYLARILGLAGDPGAAAESGRAAALLAPIPSWRSYALAVAATVARPGDFAAARDAHDLLESLGGIEEGEAFVRLAWAEALWAAGDHAAARAAIAAAERKLRERADKIADPVWRARFFAGVPENARTVELARTWGDGRFP